MEEKNDSITAWSTPPWDKEEEMDGKEEEKNCREVFGENGSAKFLKAIEPKTKTL